MMITGIERPPAGSTIWSGTAEQGSQKLQWFYWPRNWLHVREQDSINPKCWMNIEPPDGAKQAVLKAVREARP
jgi:hypothetical protein